MIHTKDFFKIKVAVIFGYNGKDFYGSQKIPDNTHQTAEGELEKALYTCKMISDLNYNNLQKVSWGRGSRTDRGVHACANMINCKICLDEKFVKSGFENIAGKSDFKKSIEWSKVINEINGNLNSKMRVFGLRLVTKGFDVRKSARSRKYEYLIPLNVFRRKKEENLESEKILEEVNKIAGKFKGSHNFHNFTKKVKPNEKQSQRFILDIRVEIFKPEFLEEELKEEWLIFYLHGQSFLYHQIRKMIGSVAQSIHGVKEDNFIEMSFGKEKVDLWLAPSEGLLLERVC